MLSVHTCVAFEPWLHFFPAKGNSLSGACFFCCLTGACQGASWTRALNKDVITWVNQWMNHGPEWSTPCEVPFNKYTHSGHNPKNHWQPGLLSSAATMLDFDRCCQIQKLKKKFQKDLVLAYMWCIWALIAFFCSQGQEPEWGMFFLLLDRRMSKGIMEP